MNERRRPVPELLVERLALGELDSPTAERIRAELEAQGQEPGRLSQIEADNAELLARYEPAVMARRIAQRAAAAPADQWRRSPWLWSALLAVPAAAAVALVLTFVPLSPPSAPQLSETTRIKGDTAPALFVYRQRGTREELLVDGQAAAAGDVLQLRYAGRGKRFGLIFSVDGQGTVTRHLPPTGEGAARLPGSDVGTLPMAFALDDAPRFERFYFVAADEDFDLEPILSSAEALTAGRGAILQLPPGAVAVTFTLAKPGK